MAYVKRRPRSAKPATARKSNYRKKAPVRRARVSTGLKSYVKRVISRTEEVKTQSFTANLVALAPYAAGTLLTLDFNSVMGLVTQGTGEGQRIGNKIRPKSVTIKGFLNIDPFGAAIQPVMIKMFIGKLKQTTLTTQGSYAALYQNGNGQLPPQNNLFDCMRKINTDIFTIYHTRNFKIGQAGAAGQTNNDFSLSKMFSVNVTKHLNSLIYNDATVNPTNKGLYVWFVCVAADGSTSITCQASLDLSYDMELQYTDA